MIYVEQSRPLEGSFWLRRLMISLTVKRQSDDLVGQSPTNP